MSEFVAFLMVISKRVLSDFLPVNRGSMLVNITENHVSSLHHNSQCIENQKLFSINIFLIIEDCQEDFQISSEIVIPLLSVLLLVPASKD